MALMVQERMPLEAVLVLERLLYVNLGTFRTLVHALVHTGVPEQVQSTH